MVEYYKLETNTVINASNKIPQDMWEKKGILPYKITRFKIYTGETPEKEEGIIFTKDLVEEIQIIDLGIFDLDIYKKQLILALKQNTANQAYTIMPIYKRENAIVTLALDGVGSPYTLEKAQKILEFGLKHKKQVDIIERQVLDATSKDEVDAVIPKGNIVIIDWVD